MTMEVERTGRPELAPTFTALQLRILGWRSLLGAESQREVARRAGCSDVYIVRLLKDAAFREWWEYAGRNGRELIKALRQSGEVRSLLTLQEVQDEDGAVASVRVDAASKLLTHVQRAREHETVSAGQWLAQGKWAEMYEESKEMLKEAVDGSVSEMRELEGGEGCDRIGI